MPQRGQQSTVPLGGGFARTTAFRGQPIQLGAQIYGNVVHPDAGPSYLIRFTLSLLFPQTKKPPAAPPT